MDQLQYYLNDFGDRYLYEVNRNTFNRLGAATVFKQQFGERLAAKDSLIIVIGTDSGILLRHVIQHGVPDGSRFLFIELNELLPLIEDELSIDERPDDVHLASQDDLISTLRTVRFSDYANVGAIDLIESIGAIDANINEYRAVVADVRQQLDAVLWAHNSQLSNPSFIRCQLQNLIEEHVPAETLRDSFPGKTALLLGGGPSLDKLLPWIEQHRDEVVIFAVSRICRRLAETGVTPHIVLSIDPNDLSFDISKDFLKLDPRVLFVHANHVHFPLLAQWRGRSLYLDRRFPWRTKGEAPNIGSAGPTVTNTAFALACAMGFTQIVFAGIDLCHSSEGFSHASGSNEHDAGPRFGWADLRVKTNAGRMAETSPDFYNAINSFSAQVSAVREQVIRVINPAADAAVIEGADFVTTDEIELSPLDEEPFAALHDRMPEDTDAMRQRNVKDMLKELANSHKELRRIEDLAKQALDCNDGLFGRNGKTADFKYKTRMDKIERQLDTKLKNMSEIVRTFSARAFLHMPPSDREWTDDEIEQAGKTYYSAYAANAELLLKLVEQAQQRLRLVLTETTENPDWPNLLDQIERDNVPGRVNVWFHRNPEAFANIPQTLQSRIRAQREKFEAAMQAKDTQHARRVQALTSLGPVRSKLQLLFREKNVAELEKTADQLAKQAIPEAAELVALARGYQAELANDADTAFASYASVIDQVQESLAGGAAEESNPRLEDALRRMVLISMNADQHDQALLILETLAGLAPAYQPQYAELLKLTGNIDAAIAVYNDYLGKAPQDMVSMLRLGKLYQSIGVQDAARTAFTFVLEKEPDNETARSLLAQSGASG